MGVGDSLIPFAADRSSYADQSNVEALGSCTILCFPREVDIWISYWQITEAKKQIIQAYVEFGDFDKVTTRYDYEVSLAIYPLTFSASNFVCLQLVGVLSHLHDRGPFVWGMCYVFYSVVYFSGMSTAPVTPERRASGSTFHCSTRNAQGLVLCIVPVQTSIFLPDMLIRGGDKGFWGGDPKGFYDLSLYEWLQPATDAVTVGLGSAGPRSGGTRWQLLSRRYKVHFMDVKISPENEGKVRGGRCGLSFLVCAFVIITTTARIFLTRRRMCRSSKRPRS